jgi:hypothetical protein
MAEHGDGDDTRVERCSKGVVPKSNFSHDPR